MTSDDSVSQSDSVSESTVTMSSRVQLILAIAQFL